MREALLASILRPINGESGQSRFELFTFKNFLEKVYLPIFRERWKASTAETEEYRLRAHLTRTIGDQLLHRIDRDRLQVVLNGAARAVGRDVLDHLRFRLPSIFELAISETAGGNTITNISITLGFNEVAALANYPTTQALAMLPGTLATYQANYTSVLTQIRALEPNANLYLLGYFNPFPANPTNPAAPIFAQGGPELNAGIQNLAAEFNAKYVNTNTAFLGNEAALTYIGQYPAGFTSPGVNPGTEPIGDVHPNAAGYAVIANQVAATPEPGSMGMVGIAAAGFGVAWRMRRRQA